MGSENFSGLSGKSRAFSANLAEGVANSFDQPCLCQDSNRPQEQGADSCPLEDKF